MNVEEYTQHQLEDEGVYRAFPIAWTVEEKESGAVSIAFEFGIRSKWHGKEAGWSVDWAPGYFTTNRTWVVKKNGDLNQTAVDNLGKCKLWNGDWDALAGPPPNVFVLVTVGAETYEGKLRYRADWINPDADEPTARGGFAPADPNVLATLRSRFQSKTRAIAGGTGGGPAPAPPTPTPAAPGATPAAPTAPTPARRPAAPAAPGAPSGGAPAPTPAVAPTPATGGFLDPPAAGDLDDPVDPGGLDPGDTPF